MEQSIEAEQINNELSFIEEEADTDVPSSSNVQLNQNRSGLTRNNIVSAEKCTQTEDYVIERPSIRKTKKCTADIKAACAQVSVSCGLSTEMSRVAVQAVSKHLYHHKYYLSIDEVTTSLTSCNKISPPPAKKKFVKSKSDYIDYKYVLPSAKTIAHFQQLQSVEQQQKAAIALYNKPDDVKTTFHYDTTSSTIDGEWPALLLIFSNNQRFSLRPIFFSYEDRENITSLIIEIYERLALAASVSLSSTVTVRDLWHKTTCLMTDAVSKNLKIGQLIADKLEISYVPFHLLCKSYCVEALDRSNLEILGNIEKQLCRLRNNFFTFVGHFVWQKGKTVGHGR